MNTSNDFLNDFTPKIKYILTGISRSKTDEEWLIEVLSNSIFIYSPHWNNEQFPNAFNLEIHVAPEIFTKHFLKVKNFEDVLRIRINESSKLLIPQLKVFPDYEKLNLINSQVFPIVTEWEEINGLQIKLIEDLQKSNESIDFQNIGNSARTIMNKLSRNVFDSKKHIPKDPTKDVQGEKFKNQLHTYIDYVLSGQKNSGVKKLAKSSIEFVENSIDVMNATTHNLDAEKHLAEVCVIGTVSGISIINLIRKLEPLHDVATTRH